MTNIFSILWFEDSTTWFTMESKKLTRELQAKYSFQTDIKREIGTDYNPEELKSENKYDLILMDYKLAAGNTGEKIVDLIRKNAVLTDVILYSSQYGEMTDALKADAPMIDGVFFADRKNELFEEKLLAVINKIVRRSEDIVNLRGFFLDNTSDFEVRIKEILKIAWDKLPDQRELLQKTMSDILTEIELRTKTTIGDIRKKDDIYAAANNSKYILGISGRLNVLAAVIDILHKKGLLPINSDNNELSDFTNCYTNNISVYRNALGHKKYSDTSLFIQGKEVQIDESFHKKLRELIAKYNDLIGFIEDSLTAI